jgi:hypothetical protein
MEEIEDLWPKDLGKVKMTMPKEILLKQALYLSQNTKNILVAEVKTNQGVVQGTDEKVFIHEMYIKAPTIGTFSFPLIRVLHDFNIYPLTVFNALTEKSQRATDEKSFKSVLASIFNDPSTRNAINSVINQSLMQ